MSMLQILGALMIVALFGSLVAYMVRDVGWKTTAKIWGLVVGLFAWTAVGVLLWTGHFGS